MHQIKAIYTIPLKYGLIASFFSIFLFVILYYADRNPLLIPAFLDFRIILFPIFLVFGIREYKENKNDGYLHFWEGVSIGFQIVLIIALVMALFILVFGSWIEPGFVDAFITESLSNIDAVKDKLATQIGQEALNKSIELLPTTTLGDLSLDYFLKSLPYGLFLTIIISLILRKKT